MIERITDAILFPNALSYVILSSAVLILLITVAAKKFVAYISKKYEQFDEDISKIKGILNALRCMSIIITIITIFNAFILFVLILNIIAKLFSI